MAKKSRVLINRQPVTSDHTFTAQSLLPALPAPIHPSVPVLTARVLCDSRGPIKSWRTPRGQLWKRGSLPANAALTGQHPGASVSEPHRDSYLHHATTICLRGVIARGYRRHYDGRPSAITDSRGGSRTGSRGARLLSPTPGAAPGRALGDAFYNRIQP